MNLYCDDCEKNLGDNILDIIERGNYVRMIHRFRLPDIKCRQCFFKKNPELKIDFLEENKKLEIKNFW